MTRITTAVTWMAYVVATSGAGVALGLAARHVAG
jgi:hypothetical protein